MLMVSIVKANEPPTAQIECANCGSILEYSNADLYKFIPESSLCCHYVSGVDHFRLRCPVCKVTFTAPWITREKKGNPPTETTEE